ncbi:phasin family protein, partial [Corallococcus llansteffanensis]
PGAEAAVNFFKASVGLEVAAAEAAEEAGASRILMPSDVGALDTTTR